MWIKTCDVLINLDQASFIKKYSSNQIEFHMKIGARSLDVSYETQNERDEEFDRVFQLLLSKKFGNSSSEG